MVRPDAQARLASLTNRSTVVESLGGVVLDELKYTNGKSFVHYAFLDVYSHRTARRELSKAIQRAPSPSDSVKSASAVKDATDDPAGPRYGRPSHRFGPPTALFSKPLALLEYNLEHLESYSPGPPMLDLAFEFIVQATDFFPDEDQREGALKPILKTLLPGRSVWTRSTSGKTAKPNAVWLEDFFAYVVVELKNEPGLLGDPFLQGLLAKLITQPEVLSRTPPNNSPPLIYIVVRPIPRMDDRTCNSSVHSGEPSHHIYCCFHRRGVCGRVTLN